MSTSNILTRSFSCLVCVSTLMAVEHAAISSSKPFLLRGNSVNVEGVPSWQIAAGDDIATPSGEAVIQLRTGSRIAVLRGSRVRMEEDGSGSFLRVLTGAVRVLSATPGLRVFLQNDLANATSGTTLSVGAVSAQAAGSSSSSSSSLAARVPRPISVR